MLNIAEGICGDETAKINFRFVGGINNILISDI